MVKGMVRGRVRVRVMVKGMVMGRVKVKIKIMVMGRVHMSILLDDRIGSKELLPYFKPYDIEVSLGHLDFADAMFWISGPGNKQCMVGVEIKNIFDLVSSMRSNRLSGHQLPGLLDLYEFVVIVVMGIYKVGDDGELVVLKGKEWIALRTGNKPILWREVSNYLTTLEFKCGVIVKQTTGLKETAAYIVSLFHWGNDKEWDKHDSHNAIYIPDIADNPTRRGSFTRKTVGPVELVASCLPGVSRKAWEFGKRFKTVAGMVQASEKELESVEGIGKTGARKIYNWLRGL